VRFLSQLKSDIKLFTFCRLEAELCFQFGKLYLTSGIELLELLTIFLLFGDLQGGSAYLLL